MALKIALLAAAAAVTAGAASAATIEIRDAVVRVTVIPEDRRDVLVQVVRPHAELPLNISTVGDRTVIDGNLDRAIRNCDREGPNAHIRVRGVGNVSWEEMPQIVIRAPRAVVLSSSGAAYGSIGRSASLEMRNSGCSGWTVADVAGDASIHTSGAGSVRMGASNRLTVRLSGAGQVHATQVRQSVDAVLSGAGGFKLDQLAGGALTAQVSGVGQIRVADGRASSMRAQVSGVGGISFGGAADSLDAQISGFGGVKVRQVNGPIRKSVSGSGHVTIGEPT
jgi:hypothetical protein